MPIVINCDDCEINKCETCVDGDNFTKSYHRARKYAYVKREED